MYLCKNHKVKRMTGNVEVKIETERLEIIPLNINQLEKYLRNDNSLEEELNLNKIVRNISDELREAMALTIIPSILDKPEDYFLRTLWAVIHKAEKKIIAGVTLMQIKGSDGEIEIGFGTGEEYRNKGYMTEAVGGILRWIKSRPEVKTIIGTSEKENKASHQVLRKNKLEAFHESESMICWRIRNH
jgi:[ribosomal protein S5]-alanine N-acetyltransferase